MNLPKHLLKRAFLLCVVLVASTAFAQPYDPCDIPPGIYCTYTQGGWGQDVCSGGNVACLRNQWFDSVFPSGVVLGCSEGYTATWTTSAAVAAYVPSGGPGAALTHSSVNSNSPGGGAFTAQLLATSLNVGFASAGHLGSPFLGSLVFSSGPFEGISVDSLMELSNLVIGGCQPLPSGLAFSNFVSALTDINETFDMCSHSDTSLVEPTCNDQDCPPVPPIQVEIGSHFCLSFCNDPITVYWCCPLSGGPVFSWMPGCDDSDFGGCDDVDCEPLDGDVQWTARLDSSGAGCEGHWWSATFTANDTGCVCVWFERQLSVELMGFTALAGNGNVRLDWTTGAERENDHFEIQRSSGHDGWTQIANVDGQGTVSYATHYNFVDNGVENGVNYRYRLIAVDMSGQSGVVGEEVLATPNEDAGLPAEFALHPCYPNPFNPTTSIRFDIPEASRVLLTVFDVNGRQVATLVNGNLAANSYTVSFDAANLSSGTYFYRLEAGSFTSIRKMLLLK